ncbi:hypothetical protein V6N12_028937 [Hibiscus sabdariffa]|uniref:Uncharacterized protein n=1 Tax=Hibiscus sabdariffa TaxID=183260 RepID=A0ABR2F7A6_9ROSI
MVNVTDSEINYGVSSLQFTGPANTSDLNLALTTHEGTKRCMFFDTEVVAPGWIIDSGAYDWGQRVV